MQTTSIKTILAVAGALSFVAAPANALSKTGIASFYDTSSGTQTASGQRLDDHALTAAMRAPVPLGTRVRVTNLGNGRVVPGDAVEAVGLELLRPVAVATPGGPDIAERRGLAQSRRRSSCQFSRRRQGASVRSPTRPLGPVSTTIDLRSTAPGLTTCGTGM